MKHETRPTDMGMNRTGIRLAKGRFEEMSQAGKLEPPGDPTGAASLATARAELSREAPPVGTVPPPTTLKGVGKAAVKALQGEKMTVFLDKLGQRLAFERAGVRLYDAVLAKLPASTTQEGTLTIEELRRIRSEELRHMHLAKEAIEGLEADATTMTPCADLTGVMGMGLVQVVTDPRSTLTQCLDAILVAELADNDGWKMLITMAEGLGQTELAQRFTEALAEEDQHLALVRRWLAERLEIQLGAKMPPPEFGEPARPA